MKLHKKHRTVPCVMCGKYLKKINEYKYISILSIIIGILVVPIIGLSIFKILFLADTRGVRELLLLIVGFILNFILILFFSKIAISRFKTNKYLSIGIFCGIVAFIIFIFSGGINFIV